MSSALRRVIRELDCDTIGLQEVDSQPSERSDSMQLEYLAKATGMQQVAGTTLIRHDGEYGNGLLTRRKILDVKRHDLSYGRYEPRGALEVDLEVQGHVMRVFVMHLGLFPSERRYQMRKVLETLRKIPLDQPVVVLGDINEWMPLGRPLALAAHPARQAAVAAHVSGVGADVRARSRVGAACRLAARFSRASQPRRAPGVRSLPRHGTRAAGGRAAAGAGGVSRCQCFRLPTSGA